LVCPRIFGGHIVEINAKIIEIKITSSTGGLFSMTKDDFICEFSFGVGETVNSLGAELSGSYDIELTEGASYEILVIDG
jgi:hypothetical protein